MIASVTSISTHAPLAGRDGFAGQITRVNGNFNPRAPCGARQIQRLHSQRAILISTHAPLAGRDVMGRTTAGTLLLFQPTRPLRGATGCCPTSGRSLVFQPTRPLRGATTPFCGLAVVYPISTHAPLAGRDDYDIAGGYMDLISIHAPLAGRDLIYIWAIKQ